MSRLGKNIAVLNGAVLTASYRDNCDERQKVYPDRTTHPPRKIVSILPSFMIMNFNTNFTHPQVSRGVSHKTPLVTPHKKGGIALSELPFQFLSYLPYLVANDKKY